MVRMYYYNLPGGILEMEVHDKSEAARVVDFITEPATIREMLGGEYPGGATSDDAGAVFSIQK